MPTTTTHTTSTTSGFTTSTSTRNPVHHPAAHNPPPTSRTLDRPADPTPTGARGANSSEVFIGSVIGVLVPVGVLFFLSCFFLQRRRHRADAASRYPLQVLTGATPPAVTTAGPAERRLPGENETVLEEPPPPYIHSPPYKEVEEPGVVVDTAEGELGEMRRGEPVPYSEVAEVRGGEAERASPDGESRDEEESITAEHGPETESEQTGS